MPINNPPPTTAIGIQDEGVAQADALTINVAGAGASVAVAAGVATITVPGGGSTGDLAITQQTLLSNLSVATSTNAITFGHLNLGTFTLTLLGTARLFVA